ncbi:hypothetical protein H2200_003343 [Cladophialophora chaetospira]|uniref:Uncharacterized protein n=1 Tax=Cladophialophora chaetospira TaxID=386627 RepID=A0AA39CML4_9EURO|nr:hypothetical protein H2200_003343 [Cladophialophora chaetospira]
MPPYTESSDGRDSSSQEPQRSLQNASSPELAPEAATNALPEEPKSDQDPHGKSVPSRYEQIEDEGLEIQRKMALAREELAEIRKEGNKLNGDKERANKRFLDSTRRLAQAHEEFLRIQAEEEERVFKYEKKMKKAGGELQEVREFLRRRERELRELEHQKKKLEEERENLDHQKLEKEKLEKEKLEKEKLEKEKLEEKELREKEVEQDRDDLIEPKPIEEGGPTEAARNILDEEPVSTVDSEPPSSPINATGSKRNISGDRGSKSPKRVKTKAATGSIEAKRPSTQLNGKTIKKEPELPPDFFKPGQRVAYQRHAEINPHLYPAWVTQSKGNSAPNPNIPEKYRNLPKLTHKLREQLKAEGKCFSCQEVGHRANSPKCPLWKTSSHNPNNPKNKGEKKGGRQGLWNS